MLHGAVIFDTRNVVVACMFLVCAANCHAGDFVKAEQVSEEYGYRALVQSRVNPIEINQMHKWVLTLLGADGAPVENAKITITGGMPEHNHGLPTAPRVTAELQPGIYLVEGLKFQMAGNWVVNFDIFANNKTDSVTFDLTL